MNTRDPRSIVRRALITEKGTLLRELRGQYHFEVARDANKIEIKHAIEAIFSVKVAEVRTLQAHGKVKRQGRWVGRRNDWKKAIVTLRPDQKIELFEQV
jgi:large subunit ribosomal protein L23